MDISVSFLLAFVLVWLLTAFTQFLQIITPEFHSKIGFMARAAYTPAFEWYRLKHRGVAFADMTFAVSGILFMVAALLGERWAFFFGFYTCAVYFYAGLVAPCEWFFLRKRNLSPIAGSEYAVSIVYMLSVAAFGVFGMVYLWSKL